MFLSRVFSIPVRFFIALLVCFPWELLAGEVVTAPVPEFSSPALIPYPSKVVRGKGSTRFKSVHVHLGRDVPRRDDLVREMKDVFRISGIPAAVSKDVFEEGSLTWELSLDAGIEGEAYVLSVTPEKTTVRAGDFGGFFNALQTLRQLVSKEKEGFFMPSVQISDEPAFALRGMMLDVGRYYMSPAFIKELMRRVSRYKINTLHLHLTDDPAWRLEVKKYPALTDRAFHWKSRLPGKFYTQEQLKDLTDYCARLNIQVIPEIDMPGHSQPFAKAMKTGMQTEKGISILKDVVDETVALFPGRFFHMGSDEVHITMKDFIPRMAEYIRGKGKEVIVWSPGGPHDKDSVLMCWGESEAGARMDKGMKRIDSNGFYIDWADSQSGVYQVFFQQPCEVPQGDEKALGAIMPVWCDGNLSSEKRVLEQYPLYPCVLTFAERVWRGSATKRKDYMAQLPPRGTAGWAEFREFEQRLASHRDRFFRDVPFAYVKQADMAWSLIGPFDHRGKNDTSFEPGAQDCAFLPGRGQDAGVEEDACLRWSRAYQAPFCDVQYAPEPVPAGPLAHADVGGRGKGQRNLLCADFHPQPEGSGSVADGWPERHVGAFRRVPQCPCSGAGELGFFRRGRVAERKARESAQVAVQEPALDGLGKRPH